MSHPADFHAAHVRHWQDAELLFEHQRWANADHLYGLSAECGLKAVMVGLGMDGGPQGALPRQYLKHVNALWSEFVSYAIGTSFQYLDMLPDGEPFDDWSTADRYAHGRHFGEAGVSPHRSAADAVRRMMQTALLDRAP